VSQTAVLNTYADIALATYEDSLTQAVVLHKSIEKLVMEPSETNLILAKQAWLNARIPYQQSEAYRFGNPVVDDWEGKVNAWPLDEGLIDYVDASYGGSSDENDLYLANVINSRNININGTMVNVSNITPDLIGNTLHEAEEVESNVASGYHAIEFLLWGQDLNGTGPGAGARPASDYDVNNCSNGNCARRGEYLLAASTLLQTDLEEIVAAWKPRSISSWTVEGEARKNLTQNNSADGIIAMITGMGSLSYGELAGERMKLGLMLNDPEEEHDCFSDNTHNSHYYDAMSIQNVYLGEYQRIDGSLVEGTSLSSLVAQVSPQLDARMKGSLEFTMKQMQVMVERAHTTESYDQMIASGNKVGNQVIQNIVDSLTAQTSVIEELDTALLLGDLAFEGSDSLDNPTTIQ
jgi:putative iron-regulated protein|tara:strand:- start:1380 stop:2600 length:1221 start_codon:yes stop_codon:yes gene_type:complete